MIVHDRANGGLLRSLGFLLRRCGLRIHQLLDEEELSPSGVCMFPIAAGLLVSEGPTDALDTLLAIADVDGYGHEFSPGMENSMHNSKGEMERY